MIKLKKTLREKLLNLCGYEIWPPTHGDPRIKGPQPRIITRKQAEAIRKMAEEHRSDEPCCVCNGDSFAEMGK